MAIESDVPLNPGAGGSLIRSVKVTTPLGVVEQQVTSQADPTTGSLQQVTEAGAASVVDTRVLDVMTSMLSELKKIRQGIGLLVNEPDLVDPDN